MKSISLLGLFCAVLLGAAPTQAQLVVNGYTNHNIHGWDVLVNDEAQANHAVGTNAAIAYLTDRLYIIVGLSLRSEVIDSLRVIPIFMEWDKRDNGAAEYHSSLDWLLQNGYVPEKAKAVEISNMTNFVNWSQQNQPWMVMHELAHGYHDRIFGFGDATIYNAFLNAQSRQLYQSVLYNPGGGAPSYHRTDVYAMVNHMEYFAEITEAYLGRNDFYPFVRAELESHDVIGFALTSSIWLQSGATGVESALPDESDLHPMYPNPTTGLVWVDGLGPRVSLQVTDVLGRKVLDVSGGSVQRGIDLSDQPAGLYLIRYNSKTGIKTRKVLKSY